MRLFHPPLSPSRLATPRLATSRPTSATRGFPASLSPRRAATFTLPRFGQPGPAPAYTAASSPPPTGEILDGALSLRELRPARRRFFFPRRRDSRLDTHQFIPNDIRRCANRSTKLRSSERNYPFLSSIDDSLVATLNNTGIACV